MSDTGNLLQIEQRSQQPGSRRTLNPIVSMIPAGGWASSMIRSAAGLARHLFCCPSIASPWFRWQIERLPHIGYTGTMSAGWECDKPGRSTRFSPKYRVCSVHGLAAKKTK